MVSPDQPIERPIDRDWVSWAVEQVEADAHRSADTHLIGLHLPRFELVGLDFYFKDESTHPTARLLGRPFIAVMPRSTSAEKVALSECYGAKCHFVEHSNEVYDEARSVAESCGGHYMDQFTFAERATDWRGNNNIAESMFAQMDRERFPVP